ncbi:MAG: hypothetical protein HRT35_20990 [Algicola sp.]|nr:hypothetical protein [Algicola sp.]
MNRFNRNITAALSLLMGSFFTLNVQASTGTNPTDEAISAQQKSWAVANYQLKDDAQQKAFEKLILDADNATQSFPDSAKIWAWSGIIKSSYAAVEGGLGALSLVKAAKKDFEKALALDENALEGSTYASLALLYHKVPGWPIAFGSDDKAEEFFKKALKINPLGRESNFFYGEFLYDERKYKQAKNHLLAAKNVPFWADRPVAYKHRQQQITAMLAKVEKRLAKRKNRR